MGIGGRGLLRLSQSARASMVRIEPAGGGEVVGVIDKRRPRPKIRRHNRCFRARGPRGADERGEVGLVPNPETWGLGDGPERAERKSPESRRDLPRAF